MIKYRVAKLLTVAAQLMILAAAPGLVPTQSPAPPRVQPPAASRTQADPYADAFAGLTYTQEQTQAIGKIQQEMASRKSAVLKDDKLTQSQKDAMLTGYTRIQYGLIYKQLTPEQKQQVSTRMHARRASDEALQKTKTPMR